MQTILVCLGLLSGVAYWLDTRKSRAEYTLQKATLDAAQVGRWAWKTDQTEDCLKWDDNMFTIFGADKESFRGTYQDFAKTLHPDDLHKVSKLVEDTIKSGGRYNANFQVIDKQGKVREVTALGAMLDDKTTMAGIVILHATGETEDVLRPLETTP